VTSGIQVAVRSGSALAVFQSRDFRLMWLGQLVETSGSALISLAIGRMLPRTWDAPTSPGSSPKPRPGVGLAKPPATSDYP
jgi:hypothetical protein